MKPSPTCGSGLPPSLDDEDALSAWLRQGLAARSGQASEADERRLLQSLKRLRPALQQAMAEAGQPESQRPGAPASAVAFELALAQCRRHD